MTILQTLIVALLCGNMSAFLVDDQDAGDVFLNAVEELTFTTVATSDSILFPSSNINSRRCENEMIGWCSLANDTNAAVHIFFPEAKVVDTLTFDSTSIDCTRVSTSDMEKFALQFLDPEDQANQFRTYDVNISGPLLGDQGRTVYNLIPTIYTRVLKIIPNKPGTCFALKISGSNGTGLCPKNYSCQNGGRCSGLNQCSCPKGFMGQMCETPVTVESIEVDNFEFLKMTDGVIETPAANFTATGNVTLQNAKRRRFSWHHRCWFHGPHAAIHSPLGYGLWGHSHSHSHGHHGLGSLWHHINPFHGFSHSLHVSFGHRHDHHHTSCLFQYHPHVAQGVKATCHYVSHFLHYFVHHGTHLFNLKVPFRPVTGRNYEVVLSFSLTHGISLHLNGHLLGSQTKPSIQPHLSASLKPGISIGMCLPPLVGGPVNMAVSGLVSAGLHLAGLAANGLMHLLLPHTGHPPNVVTKPALPTTTSQKIVTKPTLTSSTTATTRSTTATISSTAAPTSTTAPTRAFTRAPVTATSSHTTTVSSNGPLCYSCSQQATDGSCKSVTKCKTSDVCALFQDSNGFTHKCLDQQVCSQAQTLIGAGCWKCCSGPLCNDRCSSSTKPCTDMPNCALMQGIGYNVCSSSSMANKYCRKTCHIC